MHIVVYLRSVPDNTRLRPEQVSGTQLPAEGVDSILNPFDEYALETALRLKESQDNCTLTAITLGNQAAKDILKKAIAAGTDEALLIQESSPISDAFVLSQILAKATEQLSKKPSVLLFGQQSLDYARGQTGPMVAEYLGFDSLTYCKSARIEGDQLIAQRETERGIETHHLPQPSALCMMKCDYELRKANIKGVMKANKTIIPEKTLAEMGLELPKAQATIQITHIVPRPPKAPGKTIDGSNPNEAASAVADYIKQLGIV